MCLSSCIGIRTGREVPAAIYTSIASYLDVREYCILTSVCTVAKKSLSNESELKKYALSVPHFFVLRKMERYCFSVIPRSTLPLKVIFCIPILGCPFAHIRQNQFKLAERKIRKYNSHETDPTFLKIVRIKQITESSKLIAARSDTVKVLIVNGIVSVLGIGTASLSLTHTLEESLTTALVIVGIAIAALYVLKKYNKKFKTEILLNNHHLQRISIASP